MTVAFDIRSRMLVAALLPVTLVALVLAAVLLRGRAVDIAEAHDQRARSLIRQMAAASEFGLFSANAASLQAIVGGAMRQPEVRAVQIVDVGGQVLARGGMFESAAMPTLGMEEAALGLPSRGSDLLVQPVRATQVKLEDLFERPRPESAGEAAPLGHVVMEFSRDSVLQRERDMLWLGLLVTLGGLLLGGWLAIRLARSVNQPVLRMASMIERIGRGEMFVRGPVLQSDPLHEVQRGLNQMAARLESGREELSRRIAAATFELREKKEEAEAATQAKSSFIAAASHDLRQPLHALGMFVARLSQLPLDQATRQLIGNLDESVLAMQNLLDALLDVSRLEAESVRIRTRPTAVNELFDMLRSALAVTAADKGLRLRVRPSDAWIMSDPSLLHRILLNLVGNAIRYTARGTVLVSCRSWGDGRLVRIEVWDSGIGIAPEHHADVFKEFFQVGNPQRNREQGLGLGLNIVKRTARLLGHRLHLRSGLGCGTRFTIEVPKVARPDASHLALPASPALTMDRFDGLAVMVVEDDALASEGLTGLLQSWGCEARHADGLEAALALVAGGWRPSVIVSDYRLRDAEHGIETVRRLRLSLGSSVPACLMSGNTDPQLMQAARQAGLTLLHKPVRPAKLRSLLRKLVDKDAPVRGEGG
ncbi:ATP-binding protein [Rhodoferax sp.]|uniref:hybrid sensor histidine kinase/response regulator n=1 Tax=Rhodoferax sp. TaxID=50421 RepID=UPI0027504FC1|nr:ATP-binding protein [Rhodoferax sp.]